MSRIGLFEALVRDCSKVMCSTGKYRGKGFGLSSSGNNIGFKATKVAEE